MKYFLLLLILFPWSANSQGFPKKPTNYVTSEANIISKQEEELLNTKLRAFEDSTSNQLFIYLDDRYDNDLEDYSKEIFNTWGVGQKDKNNGILIAIFTKDREYRIQVGYGLEAALPSALCKQIQDEYMEPHFKENNFYEGINAGVDKLIYYTKNQFEPPNPLKQRPLPVAVGGVAGLVLFIINLRSLKKWNSQPKRKRWYLLLNILFFVVLFTAIALVPSFKTAIFSFFKNTIFSSSITIVADTLLTAVAASAIALFILCMSVNDTSKVRYDGENDDAYDRRMREREERERSNSSSSDDSFRGGGGGSSDSGGSSSRW